MLAAAIWPLGSVGRSNGKICDHERPLRLVFHGGRRVRESDVHVLIRDALDAALEHLSPKADADLASIEHLMKTVTDDDYHEHLVDEHVGVMSQYGDQERFLRNIALVALASRLAHTLLKMARTSEFLKPREGPYGERGDSEFDRLWKEYAERFGLDFDTNAARIAFTEPRRQCQSCERGVRRRQIATDTTG